MKDNPDIQGLNYLPDFISETVARHLLGQIDSGDWSTELNRRVQHYGYRYDYRARTINIHDRLGPLPVWLDEFVTTYLRGPLMSDHPDQVIVNEYLPGQGISAHIDCIPCFDKTIASLSLASPATMMLIGPTGERETLYLQPRSLVVLSGDARSKWRHAIPARKSDTIDGKRVPRGRRISLTFRRVLAV